MGAASARAGSGHSTSGGEDHTPELSFTEALDKLLDVSGFKTSPVSIDQQQALTIEGQLNSLADSGHLTMSMLQDCHPGVIRVIDMSKSELSKRAIALEEKTKAAEGRFRHKASRHVLPMERGEEVEAFGRRLLQARDTRTRAEIDQKLQAVESDFSKAESSIAETQAMRENYPDNKDMLTSLDTLIRGYQTLMDTAHDVQRQLKRALAIMDQIDDLQPIIVEIQRLKSKSLEVDQEVVDTAFLLWAHLRLALRDRIMGHMRPVTLLLSDDQPLKASTIIHRGHETYYRIGEAEAYSIYDDSNGAQAGRRYRDEVRLLDMPKRASH